MKLNLRQHPVRKDIYITSDGRVFQELHATRMGSGYRQIRVRNGTASVVMNRHVLVVETYKGLRPSPKHETCHINGNPSDDRVVNLRWGIHAENVADAIRHGTFFKKNARVLTEREVRKIKQRIAAGESSVSIAADFHISQQQICNIKKGRNWKWV